MAKYPASLNLDKEPEVSGELQGIKGQYLILSTGVINMRKYGGYELEWEWDPAADVAAANAPSVVATMPASIAPAPAVARDSAQTSLF